MRHWGPPVKGPKSLVSNDGEGEPTKRKGGGGASKVLPLHKVGGGGGSDKVLTMLKGGGGGTFK